MKKAIAEFIGTSALVLFGCGTAVIAGMGSGATSVDILGIAASRIVPCGSPIPRLALAAKLLEP